jgi:hypothetical protein
MKRIAPRILFAALLAAGSATPVYAQATRTWVSGVGDDVNPCSRTAPCKTFAGAISKTAPGGEINCLDPGGFGAVTITKSITIDCTGTLGGVLASSTTGVIVNGAGVIVSLRGISINGGPPNLPGVNGIRFLQGSSLTVEDVIIFNFTGAAPNGHGIRIEPGTSASVRIVNSTIRRNGVANVSGGGILIQPTGAGGSARVELDNVNVFDNGSFGVSVNTTGNTGPSTQVSIVNSNLSGNPTGLNVLSPAATTGITVALNDSVVFGNNTGIRSDGGTIQVAVGNTSLQANGTALVTANGGSIQSWGDNRLTGNSVVSAFNNPALIKQ